ncbi:head maturation protease, ClpP-related [uncultured Tateyamaria sp.]|uniref:head maturation protease, ClpP-related n=1 Tax=uncultured Tateyamaria sp. TaxID=455651 RepID=UPI002617B7A8|nr:head maturation protease, ClpP-related [uncultured Tateyamaria sp.]
MDELYLYGTVGRDFWGEDCFTAADVSTFLDEAEGDITVYVNSGGGLVHEGVTIYNLLRAYAGHKRVVIQGVAASIASVIVLAGDDIVMGDGAMMMVHDPAQWFIDGRGTEDEHRRVADGLGKAAQNMAKLYARRTGMSQDEAREIMRAETWMDGDEALEQGFVTELAQDPETDVSVAAFDYALYANAPAAMKSAGREIQSQISQLALVAMIAGRPAQERSQTMAKRPNNKPRGVRAGDDTLEATAGDDTLVAGSGDDTMEAAADDDTLNGGEGDDTMAAADGDDTVDGGASDDDDDDAATASTLTQMAASFGLPAAVAQHMIDQGMTATQAAAHLAIEVQGENPMTNSNRRGPNRTAIIRDERETLRAGMTGAIVAQMGRAREVDGRARQYMGMPLVEMAAHAIGYTGPVRSAADRIAVFEAATHSTSDFPAIFENALHKRLLASYEAQAPTYQQIAERQDFMDFREVPLVRPGDFPELQKINENGEIKHGTFSESKETAILSSYGRVITISRQMMINDDLGAIDRVLSNYGQRVAQFEDKTFYAFALAAKMADGNAMFGTARSNLAASGAALSVTTVDAGLQAMVAQKGLDGDVLGIVPSLILTGAKQSLKAKQLIAEVTPAKSTDVNPYSGDFTHVQTPRITTNAWYLLTAPGTAGGSNWIYGFLDGAEGPRVRTDEPFGRQGMAVSVEHDFGVGAQDFRYGYKNAGGS